MMKKNVVVAMLGVLAFGLSLMVLTGCELYDAEAEAEKNAVQKGGSIIVENTSSNTLYFKVYYSDGKGINDTNYSVSAQKEYPQITVVKDDNYRIDYSTSSYSSSSGGSAYINVSGGGSFRVQIPSAK